MKRNNSFLLIAFLILLGVTSLNAQKTLNGEYIYSTDSGRRFRIEFEQRDDVYFSYNHNGGIAIGGKWSIENGIIKIVLERRGALWILKLKEKGDNLEIADALLEANLPEIPDIKTVLPAGTLFAKAASKLSGPNLTVKEVGKRVFRLVEGIHSIEDVSPANILAKTGIRVIYEVDDYKRYGFRGNTINSQNWGYLLSAYPGSGKGQTDHLRFEFYYQFREPIHPKMPKKFQDFNLKWFIFELQKAGFSSPEPLIGEHERLLGWRLTRDRVVVTVSALGRPNGKSNLKPHSDNYIKWVSVSFKSNDPE